MQTTSISWCDYSWNPVTGCTHAGPECTNCWAEKFMQRQAKREDAQDYMSTKEWVQENAEELVTTHDDRLDEPLKFGYPKGPGRIFVVSMGDLFHKEVPKSFSRQVIAVARQMPENEFIFLTKRPHRAAELDVTWPDNAIVGTSVGSGPGGQYPDTTHRIEDLRGVDARRWVSFEPLIEPIGNVDLDHIEWAVVGGESASDGDRREMDHAWAREILDQCRDEDVAFHFKQSSASTNESGTLMTVKNEEHNLLEQRKIREYPPIPKVTETARNAGRT